MDIIKKSLTTNLDGRWQGLHLIDPLLRIILGPTSIGKSGYPILAEESYLLFINEIPHILKEGNTLLCFLKDLLPLIESDENFDQEGRESAIRAHNVLKRVILTGAVTCPSDLWLLRQVFSSFNELGLSEKILQGNWFSAESLAFEAMLDKEVLYFDLHFLHSRGYLLKNQEQFKLSNPSTSYCPFKMLGPLDEDIPRNMIPLIVDYIQGKEKDLDIVERFFSYKLIGKRSQNWVANLDHIELGYRLLPLVLACRYLEIHNKFDRGVELDPKIIKRTKNIYPLLCDSGVVDENNRVTELGERVFKRGPGPYGIIHAYYAYLKNHSKILRFDGDDIWVARGENVSASQDANAKTFKQINTAIDLFCKKFSFKFNVFIEHAVGQGEASRQRFSQDGEEEIQYFGADLEDSAIDRAIENQKKQKLAQNMKFIRNADIGRPEILIEGIKKNDRSVYGSVMVVGNGFHEVRGQNNEKMIDIFKGYCDAGIIIAFTEESGLSDEDLLFSGWNTYHAGFRYVHDISGQGLRPAIDREDHPDSRFSWKKCATLAGYEVMEEFSTRTRTVYPHPRSDGHNPSISVNYFCVPKVLLQEIVKSK